MEWNALFSVNFFFLFSFAFIFIFSVIHSVLYRSHEPFNSKFIIIITSMEYYYCGCCCCRHCCCYCYWTLWIIIIIIHFYFHSLRFADSDSDSGSDSTLWLCFAWHTTHTKHILYRYIHVFHSRKMFSLLLRYCSMNLPKWMLIMCGPENWIGRSEFRNRLTSPNLKLIKHLAFIICSIHSPFRNCQSMRLVDFLSILYSHYSIIILCSISSHPLPSLTHLSWFTFTSAYEIVLFFSFIGPLSVKWDCRYTRCDDRFDNTTKLILNRLVEIERHFKY